MFKITKIAAFFVALILVFKKWNLLIPDAYYINSTVYMENFLADNGYPLETHEVITDDGYILTLHRIPFGRAETANNVSKTPVFLMHGIICTAFDWIILGPEKAMALVLSDAGYDVWLGNNRGNTFSRKHVSLSPDEPTFWNYSYHDIGVQDLPAMIDKVLNVSGREKLIYIGFSEGFTSFAVMGSVRPEYNDKILLMNAFAPVTNMHNVKSPIINFLADYPSVITTLKYFNYNELLSIRWAPLFRIICKIPGGDMFVPWLISLAGVSHQLDKNFLTTLFVAFPGGLSLKQLEHYVQGARYGHFRPYDYGQEMNLKIYKSKVPAPYDLTKITAPIVIYYGEDDYLVNNDVLLKDVAKKMTNIVETYLVPYKHFNHLDFIWGKMTSSLTEKTLKNVNIFKIKNP